jgi:hypothetical protein
MSETLEQKVLEYPLLNDWQLSELLNTPDESLPNKKIKLDVSLMRGILLKNGEWLNIELGSQNHSDPNVKNICMLTMRTMEYTHNLDTDETETMATIENMANTLVNVNLISEVTKNKILNLTNRYQSWAEYNNVLVTPRTVGIARGGN